MPQDLAALIAAHAEGALRHAGAAPVLLCGHSSGGLIAQALAQHLERLGRPAAGVVLLDTPWPDRGFQADTLPAVLALLADRPGALAAEPVNPTRLTATGAYLRLLDGRTPGAVSTRTLLVRAERPLDGVGALTSWALPHVRADVPGDHFTMLTEHAALVAREIDSWAAAGPPGGPTLPEEPAP